MTSSPQSTGSTLRRIAAAIILVPLAVVIIAFAVANRQDVTVALDPFGASPPAAWQTQPLFVVIILVLILGVLVGGIATWPRQAKWRRTARRLEREVADLRSEIDALKRNPVRPAETANPPERLQLKPPLR